MKQGKPRAKAWCRSCDGCLLRIGIKCPLCGVRFIGKGERKLSQKMFREAMREARELELC